MERKKVAYLEKIKKASSDALLIVAADKMCNLQGYFNALRINDSAMISDFGGTPDDYSWYYTEIGKILTLLLGDHSATKKYNEVWNLYQSENL